MRKKKSLGQHFLTNPQIAEKIASFLTPGELCVEIGPGEGILTQALSERFSRLLLIEKDTDLIPDLEKKFGGKAEIINGDILQEGERIFNSLDEFKVASNLPYNISSPITILLLRFSSKIPEMVLMYQKEVGDKIAREVSLLSCLVFPFYSVREVMRLKPGAFTPPPKVFSSVLFFERKTELSDLNFDKYLNFLKVVFDNRRKVLLKKLKGFLSTEQIEKIYDNLGIDRRVRIDGLTPEQIFALYTEIRGVI